jgi:hypothetical protein
MWVNLKASSITFAKKIQNDLRRLKYSIKNQILQLVQVL